MDEGNFTIVCTASGVEDRAVALARLLGVTESDIQHTQEDPQSTRNGKWPLQPALPELKSHRFRLLVDRHATRLQWLTPTPGSLHLSFTEGRNRYRMQAGGKRRDKLARAIGIAKHTTRRDIASRPIMDATAGLCRDAWAMASYGCPVMAFERSPWLNWMQRDALAQALANPDTQACASRLTLVHSDAASWLNDWLTHYSANNTPAPDESTSVDAVKTSPMTSPIRAIYLDPMYPERKKSAAVKKDMQVLHQLIGADTDSDKLLTAALRAAQHGFIERVVVKRPISSEPLINPWQVSPTHTHESKKTRYDVYVGQSLKF